MYISAMLVNSTPVSKNNEMVTVDNALDMIMKLKKKKMNEFYLDEAVTLQ